MFDSKRLIQFPKDEPPKLVVVVDTEEEFDWSADPDPSQTAVTAIQHIDRVQDILSEYDICPCYVVDYPVASQSIGYEPLRAYLEAGQCEIGAQLHPWVNLPLGEPLERSNMYPGNLPEHLERQRIQVLCNAIQENLGCMPVAYKAGRYGFGPNTAKILSDVGLDIDLSVCPPLDFREDGGPDYRHFSAEPFWFGHSDKPLLEIPCTGSFVGFAHERSIPIFEWAMSLRRFHVPGILSRLGVVDRLMLSPEGFTPEEHVKLTRFLYNQGVRTFTWSFHSPSVVPGNTIYVQNERQLKRFLDSFRQYFDFFFNELKGEAVTQKN
jgi:hypothetical protein